MAISCLQFSAKQSLLHPLRYQVARAVWQEERGCPTLVVFDAELHVAMVQNDTPVVNLHFAGADGHPGVVSCAYMRSAAAELTYVCLVSAMRQHLRLCH